MTRIMFDPNRPPPPTVTVHEDGVIRSWSLSRLKVFESCEWRAFLAYIKKLKTEDSEAANRGTLIHEYAEKFIRGELDEAVKDLEKMRPKLEWAREQYEKGLATVEEEWGFDDAWAPSPWVGPKTWGRAKLDLFVRFDETCGMIVDHKTGKKFGNEMEHSFQGMVYAIITFMRYPELEYLRVEFWYLDKGEIMEMSFTREQAMIYVPKVHARAWKMTTATNFKPKPSPHTCRYCPYLEEVCEFGTH